MISSLSIVHMVCLHCTSASSLHSFTLTFLFSSLNQKILLEAAVCLSSSVSVSVCNMSVCLSPYPPLSISLSICLSVCLSVSLSLSLSLSLSNHRKLARCQCFACTVSRHSFQIPHARSPFRSFISVRILCTFVLFSDNPIFYLFLSTFSHKTCRFLCYLKQCSSNSLCISSPLDL